MQSELRLNRAPWAALYAPLSANAVQRKSVGADVPVPIVPNAPNAVGDDSEEEEVPDEDSEEFSDDGP